MCFCVYLHTKTLWATEDSIRMSREFKVKRAQELEMRRPMLRTIQRTYMNLPLRQNLPLSLYILQNLSLHLSNFLIFFLSLLFLITLLHNSLILICLFFTHAHTHTSSSKLPSKITHINASRLFRENKYNLLDWSKFWFSKYPCLLFFLPCLHGSSTSHVLLWCCCCVIMPK